MPRFRLTSQKPLGTIKEPERFALRGLIHESGRKTLLRSDIAGIVITRADGTIDKVVEEHDMGTFSQKEAEVMMRDPQKVGIKKLSRRLIRKTKRQKQRERQQGDSS